MAVNVALAVGAAVNLAALVSWNDIVTVIDAAQRSGFDELREHRHDAPRKLPARLRALITATASFPLTSAATTEGAITSTTTATATATATG